MRTRRKSNKKCDHNEAVVNMIAGLQRTVCLTCGSVSIQYDHNVCTEWPESVARRVDTDEAILVGVVNR